MPKGCMIALMISKNLFTFNYYLLANNYDKGILFIDHHRAFCAKF